MGASDEVFVSSLSTGNWESDPETGCLTHVLCSSGRVEAGLARFDTVQGPLTYTLPERETLLVLEGSSRIEIAGGRTLEMKEGDMVSLPKGTTATWHLTTPYREFFVFGAQ